MDQERKVVELNLDDILPNRFQPRIRFDENSIFELSESIREHGVIQPIVVRKIGSKYEIIAGERRYKASVMAGKTTIPAIITELNDNDSVEIALIENVQRENLTAIEEAISYRKILDMEMYTQEQLAEKLGKNQSTVANKLRLLNLDEEVQEALLENKISERHARSLLKISSPKQQREMLKRIIDERLTVRKTDEEIAKFIKENKNIIKPIIIEEEVDMMNNENMNMPTTPIVEDVVSEVVEPVNSYLQPTMIPDEPISVEPTVFNNTAKVNPLNIDIPANTMENPNGINPSFMDVEKIENEAAQIYEERPLADMDNLLKSNNEEVIAPMPEPVEPVTVEEPDNFIPQGKFFDILADDEEEEGEQKEVEVVSTPESQNLSFDNLYNNVNTAVTENPVMPSFDSFNPVVETPVEELTSPFEVPVVPIEEPVQNIEVPVVEEIPAVTPIEENVMPTYNEPVIPNFDTPAMENEPVVETPVEELTNTFEVPVIPTVEPVQNVEVPVVEEIPAVAPIEENTVPTYNEPVIPSFDTPTMENVPVVETPVEESTTSFEVPVVPMEEPVQNVEVPVVEEIPAVTPIEENVLPRYDEPVIQTLEQPIQEEPVIPSFNNFGPVEEPVQNVVDGQMQPQMPTNNKNMRQAIDIIRNCASQLEALGFAIDSDEIDLENMYQVIIKVDK